jgi:hypothetical protein
VIRGAGLGIGANECRWRVDCHDVLRAALSTWPHQSGQLVADEKTKAFPTQSVTEVLRERLWFQSPYGDEPIQLRQVLYAPALEVRQTTVLLGEGLGWIYKGDEGTEFELEPLVGSAGELRDGAQPHGRRVPVRECRSLDVAEFIKPGDDGVLASWLIDVAAGKDPAPPTSEDAGWAAVARPPGNAVLVVGHQPPRLAQRRAASPWPVVEAA